MATVVCKYCSQNIEVEKASGTVFCTQCQKAFWAGGAPSPAPSSSTSVRVKPAAPEKSVGMKPFVLGGVGVLCFAIAGVVTLVGRSNRNAIAAEKCEKLEKQIVQTKGLLLAESTKSTALDEEIAQEESRAEELRKREAQAAPVAVSAPAQAPLPAVKPAPAPSGTDVTQVIGQRMKSVVVIRTNDGLGSGFIVSADGVVVTNRHVAGAFESVEVQMQRRDSSDKIVLKGRVIALDEGEDLALIKLPAAPESVAVKGAYPVTPIRSNPMLAGDKVIAVGSPGLETGTRIVVLDYTVTRGIVSEPARIVEKRKMVQTTATVNPGNSGGPLLDERGNVVGVITLKSFAADNIGYALSAETLCEFLQRHTIAIEKKKVP